MSMLSREVLTTPPTPTTPPTTLPSRSAESDVAFVNRPDLEQGASIAPRRAEDGERDDGGSEVTLGDDGEEKVAGKVDLEQLGGEEVEWTYPEGGLRAWLVVFGAFCFTASMLGEGIVWGVLLLDLRKRFPTTPQSTLNYIQGLTNFCMGVTTFFAGRAGERYGYRLCIGVGAVCTFLSLIGSALLYNSLPGLFVVQGVLLGISQGMGMSLWMAAPSQYFLRRRGLATGLAMSGAGIGGGIASLIVRRTITLGYRNAMLIYAGINGVAFVVGWLCIKERLPPLRPGEARVARNWLPKGVWTDGAWYSLMGSVSVGVFGFLCPFFYLTALTTAKCPQYAPNSLILATPLCVGSILSGVGRIFSGFVADRIGPVNTLILSFFLGGLFQVTIWPHMQSFSTIMVFACLFGFFGSWFMSMLPPSAAQLFGTKGLATIVGFGLLCNAPGQFITGSIGGYVLQASGGDYGKIAYYSGSMNLAGAFILLYARFKGNRRVWAKY